jgi:hypothetical protein
MEYSHSRGSMKLTDESDRSCPMDESATDGILPEPCLSESVRVTMPGRRNGLPLWRRCLPAGIVSIGLHLFVLPFVLTMTVALDDGLFVPAQDAPGDQPGAPLVSDLDWERTYRLKEIEDPVPEPAHYLKTRPQYIPPSPDFPLERELAYMRQGNAEREQSKIGEQQPPDPDQSARGASGSVSDESVIAEVAGIFKKLTAVLQTVMDEKTAKAAKLEITKWCAELDALEERTKYRDLPSEQKEALTKKLWTKCQTEIAALNEEIARVRGIAGETALEVETPHGTIRLSRIERPNRTD